MGRLDLLSIKKNNVLLLAVTVIFSFLLPGCNPDAGKIAYEIIYSSGNKIPPEKSLNGRAYPIEDSEIELKWNTNEGKEAVLQLINQDNVVINEYYNLPSSAARGYEGEDGFIWVCTDDWDTKQNVYSFDYIEKPDLGEKGNDTVNTLRFYLYPDSLRVALDSLIFADEEWKDMEKWSVEIPIE